jgi:hypothetical protein
MEKDESKWPSDVQYSKDRTRLWALASQSMNWHDDQGLGFLLLPAVVRVRVVGTDFQTQLIRITLAKVPLKSAFVSCQLDLSH